MSTNSLTLDEQHAIREAEAWYPWKPSGADQPQTITGDVVALDSVWSDYQNDFRVVAVLRDGDGKMWSVRTYPTRLHDEWLRMRPQIGERVSVRFAGLLERKKDSKPYPDITVAVERDTPMTFDYGRLGPPTRPTDVDDIGERVREAREAADQPSDAELEAVAPDGDVPF
jgi:hypothetical protein